MRFRLLLLIIGCMVFYSSDSFALPKAKLTVKVVDTNGEPVVGAYAFATFTKSGATVVRGETDANGIFSAIGETTESCGVTIRQKGYYLGGGNKNRNLTLKKHLLFQRWEPWGKVETVILKDIRNPTRMYAKYTGHIKIPKHNEQIGYDLEKGDWVVPYGQGIIEDFIFTFQKKEKDVFTRSCSFELMLSNEKDGIQKYYPDETNSRSEYFWPYKAPQTGYQNNIEGFFSITGGRVKESFDEKRNYIFRVRTKLDEDGKIIDAKYGKIEGDFEIDTDTIKFAYYYNPTGNRNLEYDKKNPLFEVSRGESEISGP